MEIICEERDDVMVFNISGYMMGDTIGFFRQFFEDALREGKNRIVLNLENVRMIDSSGIGAIVFMVKRCRPQGDVRIANVRGHVKKVFCILRLYKIIDMYPSVDEAVSAFEKINFEINQRKKTGDWKIFLRGWVKKIEVLCIGI